MFLKLTKNKSGTKHSNERGTMFKKSVLLTLIVLSSINLNSVAVESSNFDEFASDYTALFGEEPASVWLDKSDSCRACTGGGGGGGGHCSVE